MELWKIKTRVKEYFCYDEGFIPLQAQSTPIVPLLVIETDI